MRLMCLYRHADGPYYCVSPTGHEDEHSFRHARVVIRDLEAQRNAFARLSLSEIERKALNAAIHHRIGMLQIRKNHADVSLERREDAEQQIQALVDLSDRHGVM